MWKKLTSKKGIGIFILIIIGAIFCVWNGKNILNYFSGKETEELLSKEELLNSETGDNSLQQGQANEEMLHLEGVTEESEVMSQLEDVMDDVRIHGFPYIKLTNRLSVGDYVDVRISFADGGDFVLLSKKKIMGIEPLGEEGTNSIWFVVSEEEILRLSSAVVDAYLNEGCSIYAIKYVSETQKEAIVNYVVSDLIKQLMEENPNIVEKAKNVIESSLWSEYEKNIQREPNLPLNYGITIEKETTLTEREGKAEKESIGQVYTEEVYKEQEEIIYLD